MSREKRRYYSEDEEGRARKRRKTTEVVDIEDRLESLITRVGEKSTSSLESNLEGLASVLEADLPNYKERILKIICTCAANLPEKITVYSTLVGLLNAKNYSCGEEFLDMILENLKEVLIAAQFDRARLMVRFLADLVNCRVLMPSALLEFFDKLLAATMEENITQVCSDWFVYTVLSSLPWAGKELSEKKSQEFEQLLSTIENYISQRRKTHIPALRVWSTDEPHPQEEYMDCLWAQIKKLKSDNWQEKHIRRPYLAFDDVLGDALQHTLPSFMLPPQKDDIVYPLPRVIYRMFDYTDVPEGPSMPGAHAIERYLVEEGIERTIHAHFKDRKECANQLLNLPGKSKVPIHYCLIEVIFSEMFRLPNSHHPQIFYGSLIIELCKLQPNSIPGIVAQATELLYERLNSMNTTCAERFVYWFSYHLSNFQFKWGWDEWVSATDAGLESPRCVFLGELFERIKRLAYHQFLIENIPDGLHTLLPVPPAPNYRFKDEQGELPGADVAKQLLEAIRAKKDVEQLQTILNNIPANATGHEDLNSDAPMIDHTFPQLRLDVLLHVVLKLGSKSFSHSFSALTRFHKLLKNVIVNEEGQIHCLTIVNEYWSTNPQMIVVLVDKLVRMQITDCSAVINWLFSKDMKDNFTKLYVWEIMKSTLKKMSKHTSKVSAEVQEAKERLTQLKEKAQKQAGEANGKSPAGEEEVAKKQQQLDELTEKLENAQRAQKQLFLIVFQRFIMILTEHIVRSEQHQLDVHTQWFKYTTERLREVLTTNHKQVFQYLSSLETLLFTSDLDPRILGLFDHFKALRC
ncbi:nuclear cap-binding protein subunit 1-like isoform X2 [Oculina patagonica]